MSERHFLVIEDSAELNDHTYRTLYGYTYSESALRTWANDRWSTPRTACLNILARDIAKGGWMMFEHIGPCETYAEVT